MTMTFSDIKLDARDGKQITDSKWTIGQNSAASAMDSAYGTSRSIFSTATFFTELWAAKTCNMEYNYAVEKDWNTATGPREVTYGKEVTDSREYVNGENKYFVVGNGDRNYTNPVSNSNEVFDFSKGFLPYVGNYTSKGTNTDYPVNEVKVNYKAPGITVGCGTYNDPYIISSADQLNTIAKTINGVSDGYPSTIRLDSDKMFVTNFSCNVLTGDPQHNEYANYKISITAELLGASNSFKDSYLVYTNAKIDPTVVDETN